MRHDNKTKIGDGFGDDSGNNIEINKKNSISRQQPENDEKNIFANFNPNKSPEEEFDPFYYMGKIETSRL
jgi:hypothetical protein